MIVIDDQDSSSLSKGSNSTSSADEDETSEEKGDFFSNASRLTAITHTKKFQVIAVRKTVKVMMKRVTRVKKKV